MIPSRIWCYELSTVSCLHALMPIVVFPPSLRHVPATYSSTLVENCKHQLAKTQLKSDPDPSWPQSRRQYPSLIDFSSSTLSLYSLWPELWWPISFPVTTSWACLPPQHHRATTRQPRLSTTNSRPAISCLPSTKPSCCDRHRIFVFGKQWYLVSFSAT